MHPGFLALSPTILKQLGSLSDAVVGGLILFLIATVVFLSGKVRDALYTALIRSAKRGSKLGAPTAAGHLEISRLLNVLREQFNPIRVCVYQFHNGDHFALANHAWKLSCTHEILHEETVSRLKDNQNMPASALIEMVEPLLNPNTNITGVQQCLTGPNGHRVLHYTVGSMPMCVAQAQANEQGVHHAFVVTMLDSRRGNSTIGYITLQFQELSDLQIDSIGLNLSALCPVAEKVGFYLTTDFKSFSMRRERWWHKFFPD